MTIAKTPKITPAQHRLIDSIASGTYGKSLRDDRYLWRSLTPCQDMDLITYIGEPGKGQWVLTEGGRRVRESGRNDLPPTATKPPQIGGDESPDMPTPDIGYWIHKPHARVYLLREKGSSKELASVTINHHGRGADIKSHPEFATIAQDVANLAAWLDRNKD